MKLRIIQMSDLHLTSDKHPIWGVDTYKQFQKALGKIESIPHVDCVVVSGDIADDGKIQTYQYADNMLDMLSLPVLWCPGNHDNINNFNEFSKKSKSAIGTFLFIKGVRILPINTVAPDDSNPCLNRSRGVLFEDDFRYLNENILCQSYPTILVMHHPPFDPGGWMTNKILDNRDFFNETIKKYDDLFLILCGHIHYYMEQEVSGKKLISAPSVGFAFNKDLPKYEIDQGKEGFLKIDIENNNVKTEFVKI